MPHRILRFLNPIWVLQIILATWCGGMAWGTDEIQILTRTGETLSVEELQIIDGNVSGVGLNEKSKLGFDEITKLIFMNESVELPDDGVKIRLVDGSVIHASEVSGSKTELRVRGGSGWLAVIPTRDIDWIRFRVNSDEQSKVEWETLLDSRPAAADALVIQRGERPEYFEGVVGEITKERVSFSTSSRTANVKRDRLLGLVYYHAKGREIETEIGRALATDGSQFVMQDLVTTDDLIRLTLSSGTVIKLPMDDVSQIGFGLDREVYLSELTPSTMSWEPLIASRTIERELRKMKQPRINEDFRGQPLTLTQYNSFGDEAYGAERQFEHGFALFGGSKLAFRLQDEYSRLTGLVGFAPQASENGVVKLVIRGDGKVLFEKVLTHSERQNPLELDLKIVGVARLTFEVEYEDRRSIGDLLHLCDLKVTQ